MQNKTKSPLKVLLSLRLLKEKLENLLVNSSQNSVKKQAEIGLQLFEKHPDLYTGTDQKASFLSHKTAINELMAVIFPATLSGNEIKAAVTPYNNETFFCSERFERIINNSNAHKHIFKDLYKDQKNDFDVFIYTIILNFYYNYNVDFERPKTIAITSNDGVRKLYRVAFNADFMAIYPNENAIDITQDILDELLANADNIEVWEKYFPENSWTIEGFGIVNLIDTTIDERIDDFKSHLIEPNTKSFQYLKDDIKNIFNISDLQLGSYSVVNNHIVPPFEKGFEMLTILPNEDVEVSKYACSHINKTLFNDYKPIIIADVDHYHKKTNGNHLSHTLLDRGLKSAALLPVPINGQLGFVLELGAFKPNQLNAINMVKLDSITPFILSYSKRIFTEYQNEISAVIQQQCTAIHPAVEWRFEEEAKRFIKERNNGEAPVFQEVVFQDVVPLFGQVDVVGSSKARNKAVQVDLTQQLETSRRILSSKSEVNFPFYEQLIFKINNYLEELRDHFTTSTEQEINLFFEKQIMPLFEQFKHDTESNPELEEFLNQIDTTTNSIYSARKAYDETITQGNKTLSSFVEEQQIKAQAIFPHYFEKYKTDGVEYNLYIGQSITKQHSYHPTVLFNLRLWQLQLTCEIEALYYQKQKDWPLQLKVASLILAYNQPITIRYRIDEKQFDVDGAYNVRYEMIKKRIDKAHIKNTTERLTQAHKLCVVYSSQDIEREYMSYFEFLQSKNYIGPTIEIVEVEELQGASGLKAIRADLNTELQKAATVFSLEDVEAT